MAPRKTDLLGLTLETVVFPAVTAAETKRYAAVSGDRNPVHTDKAVARKAGLADLPVQGMLIMGLVAAEVEHWPHCQTVKKLQLRFVSPAFVGIDLTFSARVVSLPKNQPHAILRISVKQRDKFVCMGEANVVLGRDRENG